MKEYHLSTAKAIRDAKLNAMHPGTPPRLWPVVILGPNDGYIVTTAGFAESNGFEIIR